MEPTSLGSKPADDGTLILLARMNPRELFASDETEDLIDYVLEHREEILGPKLYAQTVNREKEADIKERTIKGWQRMGWTDVDYEKEAVTWM